MKLLYVTISILNIPDCSCVQSSSALSMYLSVICHAYNGDHSRACMTSEHRAEIVHHDIGHAHFLTDEFCHIGGIFRAVAVRDHHHVRHLSFTCFDRHIHDLVHALLSAPLFPDDLKLSFIIQTNDRLDLYHRPDHRCRHLTDRILKMSLWAVRYSTIRRQ